METNKEYQAPWEKSFSLIFKPLEEFIHKQTTSGLLLIICGIISLIIANSPLNAVYYNILGTKLTIGVEGFKLSKSIHHWINDGLMAIFFFVIGLELKREILTGELASKKQAILPIIAALGGMIMPAIIYMAINPSGHTFNGWGIPMATDIAFALGTLALLGNRIPKELLTFLIALAIVDDLGAVIVIALFYTESINISALIIVAIVFGILMSFKRGGIRSTLPYTLLGIIMWIAMLKSGVHATLAGILLAFTIPMRPKYEPERLLSKINIMVAQIKESYKLNKNIILNDDLRSKIQALGKGVRLTQSPAQILERRMHIPSAYLIIPIFSLANAGVPIEMSSIAETIKNPISIGIILGLVFGKLLGIAGFSWVATKIKITTLPKGLDFNHIIGAALMGGIGFTMSIFIAELGFVHHKQDLLIAKTGILVSSLLAGVSGFIWLYITCKKEKS